MISRLKLVNFRSYSTTEFKFNNQIVLVGENGAGKSNILEAIYLLCAGKSFRADRDYEMIRHDQDFAIVQGEFSDLFLQVTITDRKKFEVNKVPRRMQDFIGRARAVLFSPSDLELITGSPGSRRRYLDFVLSQTDREYYRSLTSYEKGIRSRNKLLEKIRENQASRNQLFFWDRLLIKNGEYITAKRGEYLLRTTDNYQLVYDKSVISESRLDQYAQEEVAAATTLVGPHRDDFVVLERNRDVAKYGSRGEQRMAMLWLKTLEMERLTDGQLPILLLDDIFSELDHKHREEVLQIAAAHQLAGGQTIMTSADKNLLPQIEAFKLIEVNFQ